LSNDDRKGTVFSSRRNVVSDGAFLTDDGRLFHARAEATGKAYNLSKKHIYSVTRPSFGELMCGDGAAS